MDENQYLGRAEGKAFRLLTRRAHSENELRMKLRASGFSINVIEKVVRRCLELGYLNDETFASQRVRVLAIDRLEGDRRILLDLRRRGVEEELCRRVIAEIRREFGEAEAILRLLRKRVQGRPVDAQGKKEKARLARGLIGKGFPMSLILRTLKMTEEEGFHDDDWE